MYNGHRIRIKRTLAALDKQIFQKDILRQIYEVKNPPKIKPRP